MSEHDHPVDPDRVEAARTGGLPATEAEVTASLLTLLGDPLRVRILAALRASGEMCVGDLALSLGATEDAVSYGLRLLRTGGLVRRRREGRLGYYRLSEGAALDALDVVLGTIRTLAALHPEAVTDDGAGDEIRGAAC